MKFVVFFPVSREFRGGDRFDGDCVRHHTVWRELRFPQLSNNDPNWPRFGRVMCLLQIQACVGAIPARLSLPAKIRFPETETGFLETGSKSPLLSGNPEHLVLPRPLGRQVGQSSDSYTVG